MTEQQTDIEKRAIKVSRVLNAPINLVWDVWTKPEHIALWWGPNGFTNAIHEMDVVAGGEWRLSMLGPDGKTYPNRSVFMEIVPFKKIVFQHFNPNYVATIDFDSEEEKT